MPRILLEVSENVPEVAQSWENLHQLVNTLCDCDTIDPTDVKAFYNEYQTFCTGQGAPDGFVNIQVSLKSGRPLELRKKIAETMHAKAKELYSESLAAGNTSVSIEVREMDAETYLK